MAMFEDMPVEVGVIYEGERIRRKNMHVEFGGLKNEHKFELVRVLPPKKIVDGKITVQGPDIPDIPEGSSVPLGILINVAGKEIEEDLEGVIERRIHEYCNLIEGLMHLNQRYDIHIRISKKSVKKGLNFKIIGTILQRLFKTELPFIKKIQITFITDPKKIKKKQAEAIEIYNARDARARGLSDDEVDEFYGCSLCTSFAPTHVCVITPQRYANCGAISWFDGRASARIDPKGPIFTIEKGECVDEFKGEYTGSNQAVKEKSLGAIERVQFYTAFGYPMTSCGCFEAAAFYIPEVDGLGIVHRDFKEMAVNGLSFSTIADSTAGGRQVDGFHGLSIEYLRSPKLLQADGGWNRIVWMPAEVKERIKEFIPQDIIEKVATEHDVKNVPELKVFLEEKQHPVVESWVEGGPEGAVEEEEGFEELPLSVPGEIPITMPALGGAGFRIVLKDAKIIAKKVIIRKEKPKGRK